MLGFIGCRTLTSESGVKDSGEQRQREPQWQHADVQRGYEHRIVTRVAMVPVVDEAEAEDEQMVDGSEPD